MLHACTFRFAIPVTEVTNTNRQGWDARARLKRLRAGGGDNNNNTLTCLGARQGASCPGGYNTLFRRFVNIGRYRPTCTVMPQAPVPISPMG